MKKVVFLLVFGLASLSLSAQSRMSYSWEFVAGVGVGKGPQVSFTPEFVAQYDFGGGFRIGAGAGTRFARPCLQYITRNGSKSLDFCNELDIPVFMRLGYGKERFYVNLDAGYAIGALSFYGLDWIPGGRKEPGYNGFFVEPHVGWKVGQSGALALGILLQQSDWQEQNLEASEGVVVWVESKNTFTPAITLRYVVGF